ncbi:hypothetical protein J4E91_002116 [Alternaria rosae]|nr:hypothetical protein J4E91_002116 [Alternaria rosae]
MSTEFDTANGLATTIRRQFAKDGTVDNSFDQDQSRGPPVDQMPVFGFLHGFASSQSGSVLYTVGTTQGLAVNYRTARGDIELQPWWLTNDCYKTANNMIRTHYKDYATTILAANVLTRSADNATGRTIFQKEISSDGKVNTADVIYPALPFWLYANPELLRLLLKPVSEF